MIRRLFCAAILLWLAITQVASAATPIRFRHWVRTDDTSLPVPMELYLTAVSRDVIAFKLTGDLAALQSALPTLLTQVVEDTCRRRIGVEVQDVRSEVDSLRLIGRVQIIIYRCRNPDDLETRRQLFNYTAEFDAVVDGRIANNCVSAELTDLTINPQGLVGGILNLTGLTGLIAARASEGINQSLQEKVKCIDLPTKLRLIDARIKSGGFRSFRDGRLGFVVQGTIDVRARNLVALIAVLAREGALRN